MLDITEIRIKRVDNGSPIRAFASITISNAFAIHGIKVLSGRDGLFVAMPSRKEKDKHYDIAHPINAESREFVQDMILDAYSGVSGTADAPVNIPVKIV